MINRQYLAGGFLIAIGLSLGFGIGSLRAAGVPQTNPLLYSGTLLEDGQAVTGDRNVRVSLWTDETSTETADRTCETIANNTPVEGGRFRVALDAECTAAVHAEPEQWVEVQVGDDIIGARSKLGAVPYALEADRASSAAGDLDARIGALEATPAFRAYKTQTQPIPSASETPVQFEAVEFNDGGDFDLTTDVFTVELAGYYRLGCTATWVTAPVANYQVSIQVKPAAGNTFGTRYLNGAQTANPNISPQTVLKLAAGDQVRCSAYQASGASVDLNATDTRRLNVFEAILLSP